MNMNMREGERERSDERKKEVEKREARKRG